MFRVPMQRSRLSDTLVTEIATEVLSGAISSNASLPSEPQLCERFHVSRTVVRDAMARLQRMGIVRVRQGRGTVARARSEWHEFDPDLIAIRSRTGQITDLIPDLLEIRRMVEIESAGLAAERRSESDIASLRCHLEAMDSSLDDPRRYNDADIAFHDVLITATQNGLMRHMMRPVNELRRIGSSITTIRSMGSIEASAAGHHAILDAVEGRDAAAARDAMARHIAQFEHDLIKSFATRERCAREPVLKEVAL